MSYLHASGILFYGSRPTTVPSAFGAAGAVKIRPLSAVSGAVAFGTDDEPRWWLLEDSGGGDSGLFGVTDGSASVARAWELCHELIAGKALDTPAQYAEPDFVYRLEPELGASSFAGAGDDACPPSPGNGLWYRDEAYGGFDAANALVNGRKRLVRVAHLDTGYIENHAALPKGLRREEGRNFIAGEDPHSAIDLTKEGITTQRGHGSATMSLLASDIVVGGRTVGVAPFVDVVPFRIANRVYHIRTSAIAEAFEAVHQLNQNEATFINIVTMSMGGLASRAWAEAVNRVYEDGTFIVAAAGNNFNGLPTVEVVYPARFERVVAATGVMYDLRPYDALGPGVMTGNYGPPRAMTSALAAYTPAVPWTWRGSPPSPCFDGSGTSSATPQIAGAAALWIRANRNAYTGYAKPWQRAEAVRKALFDSADRASPHVGPDLEHYGKGVLKADRALAVVPDERDLVRSPAADASWAFWRLLPDFAAAGAGGRDLLGVEAQQLLTRLNLSAEADRLLALSAIGVLPPAQQKEAGELLRTVFEALARHPDASPSLRRAIAALGADASWPVPSKDGGHEPNDADLRKMPEVPAKDGPGWQTRAEATARHRMRQTTDRMQALAGPQIADPSHRLLRVYAVDPSTQADIATAPLTEATVAVRWERNLQPGPVGEYLEVVDVDPDLKVAYAPVDLNDHRLLPTAGLAPSESNPQFHQQMVYAIAMRTIDHFEKALGRVALWSPGPEGQFVRRLRIYPHGMRFENAEYLPSKKALRFGYFYTRRNDGPNIENGLVFNCLSHDVVAHETSHALLDGLNEQFRRPTNPDVLAFHEAFSDLVAIFQHFTMTELLRDQIARTRGDLRRENLLGKLGLQFGWGRSPRGSHGALRDFLGEYKAAPKDEGGNPVGEPAWLPRQPRRDDYEKARRSGDPHALGAVVVSAMLDAFVDVFERECRNDILLATGGTGLIPEGALPTLLVERLAVRASECADRFLTACIRALDYCPPLDINFGDYLRAVVTADYELRPTRGDGMRAAIVTSFRERGILPDRAKHLSVESVLWDAPVLQLSLLGGTDLLAELKLNWSRDAERSTLFADNVANVAAVERWIAAGNLSSDAVDLLGFYPPGETIEVNLGSGPVRGTTGRIRIHSVRPSVRAGEDGRISTDVVVEATQAWTEEKPPQRAFLGGCTVLVDPATGRARFVIRKSVAKPDRIASEIGMSDWFIDDRLQALARNYRLGVEAGDPFAILHAAGGRH